MISNNYLLIKWPCRTSHSGFLYNFVENAVKRLGRIAAKFPAQNEHEEKVGERFSSVASLNQRNNTANPPVIGRGRGILGEPNQFPDYSNINL